MTAKELHMQSLSGKRVRVLVNPRSGPRRNFEPIEQAVTDTWEAPDVEITYQFMRDVQDGERKARRAVEQGVDLLLVAGGDGTVNTVGKVLLGSDVCLGTVPTGSGNGFARHFGIPLSPGDAVRALKGAEIRRIDVGIANGRPFFVTCSMAWDAAIVRSFERSPVRGILPYIFAGAYEFFDYTPQPIVVEMDSGERIALPDPLVFTAANLTQYGGGAVIAPEALPDDGWLELVAVRRKHIATLLAHIDRILSGSITDIPRVVSRRFRSLWVERPAAAPLQMDGELVDAPARVEIHVVQKALNILVPRGGGTQNGDEG